MRGRSRMTDQRLRAAETHRELHDLEPVEEGEGLGLAALDLEGEGRAGCAALPLEYMLARVRRLEESEIVHLRDLGMRPQELRDLPGVCIGALGADAQRLERAQQHPAGMRIELGPERAAQ